MHKVFVFLCVLVYTSCAFEQWNDEYPNPFSWYDEVDFDKLFEDNNEDDIPNAAAKSDEQLYDDKDTLSHEGKSVELKVNDDPEINEYNDDYQIEDNRSEVKEDVDKKDDTNLDFHPADLEKDDEVHPDIEKDNDSKYMDGSVIADAEKIESSIEENVDGEKDNLLKDEEQIDTDVKDADNLSADKVGEISIDELMEKIKDLSTEAEKDVSKGLEDLFNFDNDKQAADDFDAFQQLIGDNDMDNKDEIFEKILSVDEASKVDLDDLFPDAKEVEPLPVPALDDNDADGVEGNIDEQQDNDFGPVPVNEGEPLDETVDDPDSNDFAVLQSNIQDIIQETRQILEEENNQFDDNKNADDQNIEETKDTVNEETHDGDTDDGQVVEDTVAKVYQDLNDDLDKLLETMHKLTRDNPSDPLEEENPDDAFEYDDANKNEEPINEDTPVMYGNDGLKSADNNENEFDDTNPEFHPADLEKDDDVQPDVEKDNDSKYMDGSVIADAEKSDDPEFQPADSEKDDLDFQPADTDKSNESKYMDGSIIADGEKLKNVDDVDFHPADSEKDDDVDFHPADSEKDDDFEIQPADIEKDDSKYMDGTAIDADNVEKGEPDLEFHSADLEDAEVEIQADDNDSKFMDGTSETAKKPLVTRIDDEIKKIDEGTQTDDEIPYEKVTKDVQDLTGPELDQLTRQFVSLHDKDEFDITSDNFVRTDVRHKKLNAYEALTITSDNFPNGYPTNLAGPTDWLLDGEGFGIELNVTHLNLNSFSGHYLLIIPGGEDASATDGIVFAYQLDTPRLYRFRDVDQVFVRFEGRGSMAVNGMGFEISAKMIEPYTVDEDPEPVPEPVAPAPVDTATVLLAGVNLKEFAKIREEFRRILADMATMYINANGIDPGHNSTLFTTQIVRSYICKLNWPGFDDCVEITFGIPLVYDDEEEHRLHENDLIAMWYTYSDRDPFATRLRGLNIREYTVLSDGSVLLVWLVVAAGVLISMVMLAFTLWRFTCFYSYKRMSTMSDTASVMNEKGALDMYPTPHQTLPPLYTESEYRWHDANFEDTKVDMRGFTNHTYIRDELSSESEEEDLTTRDRNSFRPKENEVDV